MGANSTCKANFDPSEHAFDKHRAMVAVRTNGPTFRTVWLAAGCVNVLKLVGFFASGVQVKLNRAKTEEKEDGLDDLGRACQRA